MSHIIQWNYRGLKINLIELSPVRTFFPVAFGLQEIPTVLPLNSQQSPVTFTMALIKSKLTPLLLTLPAALKETDQIQLKNYTLYSTNAKENERAADIFLFSFEIMLLIVQLIYKLICCSSFVS